LIGDPELPVVRACRAVLAAKGVEPFGGFDADVVVAPLLTSKVSPEDIGRLKLGLLIFHPSLLPRHRGRDSIKWAYRLGETYTGATWFWADDSWDTGDVCEQEVLAIVPGESPREFYERAVVPSAARLLGYIVDDLQRGIVRRRPQQHESATFELGIPKPPPLGETGKA